MACVVGPWPMREHGLLRPSRAAAAGADVEEVVRLRRGLALLEGVLSEWSALTIDCSYGEVRREILESQNKEALLAAASSTSKAATTVTMCKTSGTKVRRALGTTADGTLSKMSALLTRPALLDTLRSDEDFEAFQYESERLQRALAEADAAAFYSATSDFSAQTTFKKGDTPSAPALEKSKDAVAEARDSLAALLRVVDGER